MTCLVQSQFLYTSLSTFTNGGPETFRIDKFDARNIDTFQREITVHIVASGGTADTSTVRLVTSIQPGDTVDLIEIVGHDLDDGDSIQALADTDAVVSVRVSGRRVNV